MSKTYEGMMQCITTNFEQDFTGSPITLVAETLEHVIGMLFEANLISVDEWYKLEDYINDLWQDRLMN